MQLFTVAYELGLPVQCIRETAYDDYIKWNAFLETSPIGWREDVRAYKIMQSFGVKDKAESHFESLRKIKQIANGISDKNAEKGFISAGNLQGSSMFLKMLGAVGGDKPTFLEQPDA